METINFTKKQTRVGLALALCLVLTLSGCTLSGIEDEVNNDITEEDLEAASQILGESLSDDNSGIMSSLNDAVTTISEDGFVRSSSSANKNMFSSLQANDEDNSGRGRETHITYTYDPETGTHTLTFKRKINRSEFTKSVTDTLKYIFTDVDGDFISAPRLQRDRVETIDFNGKRQGTIETPRKNSSFSRRDTFLVDGVSEASSILSIDGVHHGRGDMEGRKENGDLLSRSYELKVSFLDIQIDKAVVEENQNLEQGVTGTLNWEMYIEKNNNGSTEVKTVRGTIEMNGDGTALLRFKNSTKLFQIKLDDGDVHDRSEEFEGNLKSVNIDRRTIQLQDGTTVRITEDTEINPESDLTTFNQIARALQEGHTVRAGGKGFVDGEIFVATRITIIIRKRNNDREEIRFEAFLTDAKPDLQQIILQDERVVQLTDSTEIDENGNVHSVADVKEALELGYNVIADGHGIETDREGIHLIATVIRFDKVEDDETEKVEIEQHISEINIETSTITLKDGTVVLVTDDTDFADGTDFTGLGSAKESLEKGSVIAAIGHGVETDREGIDIVARDIRIVIIEEASNHVEFENPTTEVNIDASTVTLEDGTVILVTDNTDLADNTDYESLGGVKEALENDQGVVTSGKGEETDEEGIDIIATLIRFTEQN